MKPGSQQTFTLYFRSSLDPDHFEQKFNDSEFETGEIVTIFLHPMYYESFYPTIMGKLIKLKGSGIVISVRSDSDHLQELFLGRLANIVLFKHFSDFDRYGMVLKRMQEISQLEEGHISRSLMATLINQDELQCIKYKPIKIKDSEYFDKNLNPHQ